MGQKLETEKKRYLKIREVSPKDRRLRNTVGKALSFVGLRQGQSPFIEQAPILIERDPNGRKGIRLKEAREVLGAIEQLAEANQGTQVRFGNFEIRDEVRVGDQVVSSKKLHLWRHRPFTRIAGKYKDDLQAARLDMIRATKTDSIVTPNQSRDYYQVLYNLRYIWGLMSGNPIVRDLKAERKEHRAIDIAESRRRRIFDRYERYKWRSKILAHLTEKSPLLARDEIIEPQSADRMEFRMTNMLLRLADKQLDPEDRIHGPLEKALVLVQKLKTSPLGTWAIRYIQERVPQLDDAAIDKIERVGVQVNKALSSDRRRDALDNARSSGVSALIDRREKSTVSKGEESHLPSRALRELQQDRRSSRFVVAEFAMVEALINSTDLRHRLSVHQQQVLAQAFIDGYQAKPKLEAMTHILTRAIEPPLDMALNALDALQSTRKAYQGVRAGGDVSTRQITQLAEPIKPLIDAARQPGTLIERARRVAQAGMRGHVANAETGSYADEPESVKQQVETLLRIAPAKLSGDLSPAMRIKWTTALNYAKRVDAVYQRSLVLTNQTQETQLAQVGAR